MIFMTCGRVECAGEALSCPAMVVPQGRQDGDGLLSDRTDSRVSRCGTSVDPWRPVSLQRSCRESGMTTRSPTRQPRGAVLSRTRCSPQRLLREPHERRHFWRAVDASLAKAQKSDAILLRIELRIERLIQKHDLCGHIGCHSCRSGPDFKGAASLNWRNQRADPQISVDTSGWKRNVPRTSTQFRAAALTVSS